MVNADNRILYGVGYGLEYNGLGGNISVIDDNNRYGFSAGCLGYSESEINEGKSTCGLGVGFSNHSLLCLLYTSPSPRDRG